MGIQAGEITGRRIGRVIAFLEASPRLISVQPPTFGSGELTIRVRLGRNIEDADLDIIGTPVDLIRLANAIAEGVARGMPTPDDGPIAASSEPEVVTSDGAD